MARKSQRRSDDGFLNGRLLIAMPTMTDPRFEKTVVLICHHTPETAMGIVLNKPMGGVSFEGLLKQLKVETPEEAFAVNNDVKYGLSSSLYTRNVELAFRAMSELDNGITYVNAPTIGAEAHLPFGGVKQTGNGHREGGWEVYEFYSETKVCYVDYSGALQRAQIDTYSD